MTKPITIIEPKKTRKPTRRPEELKLRKVHRGIFRVLEKSGGPFFPHGDAERRALVELLDHGILKQIGDHSYCFLQEPKRPR